MEKISKALLLLFLIVMSCNQNEAVPPQLSNVQFSFTDKVADNGRITSESVHSVLVSIKASDGTLLYEKHKLSLYQFGTQYISEPLSLVSGGYKLVEFFVLDVKNKIVYATPLEGSTFAHLVKDPLPIDFSVLKDSVIKVSPEVIAVDDNTQPSDLGYATFDFNIIETLTFSVAAFVYNVDSDNFELTTAHILIKNDSVSSDSSYVIYNDELESKTNQLRVRDHFSSYKIEVIKAGYEMYTETFSADALKGFTGSNVLTIELLKAGDGVNRAISFDGIDDYIDLGNIYDSVQLPITISSWVWMDPSVSGQAPIFNSQDSEENLYTGFHLIVNPTDVFGGYGDGLGYNNSYYRRDKSAPHGYISGNWVHLSTVIRGANDIDIYINGVNSDGVYTGESPNPMRSDFPNAVAKIGYWYTNGMAYHYTGLIDEVKVWKRALSALEVKEQMSNLISGNEVDLIGYWNFDEPDGSTVVDKSNNHFNGVIKGNAVRVESGIPTLH